MVALRTYRGERGDQELEKYKEITNMSLGALFYML
jgi:hypothetical protein